MSNENNKKDKAEKKEPQQQTREKTKKYQYSGSSIELFIFNEIKYILHPNCVMENLPEEAPQVIWHIEQGTLKEVE